MTNTTLAKDCKALLSGRMPSKPVTGRREASLTSTELNWNDTYNAGK